MLSFESYLTETTKNTHMTHIEDSVLYGGVDGTRQAINALRDMRNMLAGHTDSKTNVTVKWDGCVHEDTVVYTNMGEMTISEIVNSPHLWSDIKVMGKDLESSIQVDKFVELYSGTSNKGLKNWIELELENGSTLKLTEDHEVHTTNRGWVKAGDLTEDDDITEL